MHAQVNVEVVPDLLPVTSSFTARQKSEQKKCIFIQLILKKEEEKKREKKKTQISPSKVNAGWERKGKNNTFMIISFLSGC